MVQSALRARGRAVTFVLLSSAQFLLLMFFNIYFIKWRGMGLEGVLWSSLLGWGLPALVYGAVSARGLPWRFDRAVARRLLRFALPLVPYGLIAFSLMISGRLFLQHFRDAERVGIFSTANRIALIFMLVCVTPFQTVWGYLGLDYFRRADAREIFSRAFTYLLLTGLWVFLLVSAVGREIILRFGKAHYLPALPYVDPLMAGYLMLLFFCWANIAMVGREMTVRILLISLPPFAVALGGGWLAIPRYGDGVGAACAVFVAAMAVHAALTAVAGRSLIGFRLEKARVLRVLVAFAVTYGVGHALMGKLPNWRLVIALSQIVAFPLVLLVFGFLTRGEVERLRDLGRQLIGALSRGSD